MMTSEITRNARNCLKIELIGKTIVKILAKHLVLISCVNFIISIYFNYILKPEDEDDLNIVAHLLRGTFVSSIPSCIALAFLIVCKVQSITNDSQKDYSPLNLLSIILTFFSIFYTKAIFTKEPIMSIYDVVHVASMSYLLQKRFNTKKTSIQDFPYCVCTDTKGIINLLQRGLLINLIPFCFSYILSFIIDIFMSIINCVSINVILNLLSHPFDVILNLPKIYNISNVHVIEKFSLTFSVLASIWIATILEYYFIVFIFVFNKYDYKMITALTEFPMHNEASYQDEFFVVSCLYEYVKDISYKITGSNIEITNLDKKTKLKLLLFKKLILIYTSLENREEAAVLEHLCNPINTLLANDGKMWKSYIESCNLCMEDLIDQLKRITNILNHDETIYTYEEKLEVKEIFEKNKMIKLKDTIRLTCVYFKGITIWTITISIIYKNLIIGLIRKLAATLVTLSYVLFDFLNFIKISELSDPLHHLLYQMNVLVDIFKLYREEILDNKYQYSYNIYKGLSYLYGNQVLDF